MKIGDSVKHKDGKHGHITGLSPIGGYLYLVAWSDGTESYELGQSLLVIEEDEKIELFGSDGPFQNIVVALAILGLIIVALIEWQGLAP